MDAKLIDRIEQLKSEHNAVILAHNYQPGEIQDLADFCGDSLGLSVEASKTDADVIVFCGVLFMAETAAILSPDKKVLLPRKNAGCPMADMIDADQLRKVKSEHPGALVVCYVNSTAEVKAESDYCCTSSNAVEVVKSIDAEREVIFVPDKNLGSHVLKMTGRKMVLWPGYCPTHVFITEKDVEVVKRDHPDGVSLAHPECPDGVKDMADHLLSTGQMLGYVKEHGRAKYIIATENGIIHALRKQSQECEFVEATGRAICPNMKKISVADVIESLEKQQWRIEVAEEIRVKAKKALDRMVEVLPGKG